MKEITGGVCAPQGCRTRLFEFSGGRADVRHQAVRAAVELLRDAVMEMS